MTLDMRLRPSGRKRARLPAHFAGFRALSERIRLDLGSYGATRRGPVAGEPRPVPRISANPSAVLRSPRDPAKSSSCRRHAPPVPRRPASFAMGSQDRGFLRTGEGGGGGGGGGLTTANSPPVF